MTFDLGARRQAYESRGRATAELILEEEPQATRWRFDRRLDQALAVVPDGLHHLRAAMCEAALARYRELRSN